MAPDQDPPARPRRERPLVAPGREAPSEPPPLLSPPTGSRVFEPSVDMVTTERSDRVEVAFPGPGEQRRWTVALRIFLVIPHLVWLYILNIGLQFAVLIAWFAALFTKRVPDEVAGFIGRVLRYQLRVMGYGFYLLTDEYPPFGLSDDDYPIDLKINPGEHNRAAVFFRLVLMVPSMIVAGLAGVGAAMLGVLGWLLALILGRLPQPLWEANAAVLRFTGRAYAYACLVTAEQPKQLFGDKDAARPPVELDRPELPTKPRLVRLVLSKAGRRMIGVYIALAVISYGGLIVSGIALGTRLSAAYNDLDDSHAALVADVDTWRSETQQCAFSGGQPCLAAANTKLADSFANFDSEVSQIEFPANLAPDDLLADARECEDALRAMAAATEPSSYQAALTRYQRAVDEFDQEYFGYSDDVEYNS